MSAAPGSATRCGCGASALSAQALLFFRPHAARRSSGSDTSGGSPRAPETPFLDDEEGVSALQRAFFQAEPRAAAPKEAHAVSALHRSASEPAFRESIASWHLSMVLNKIGSPKHGAQQAAPLTGAPSLSAHRRVSAVDFTVLSQ